MVPHESVPPLQIAMPGVIREFAAVGDEPKSVDAVMFHVTVTAVPVAAAVHTFAMIISSPATGA